MPTSINKSQSALLKSGYLDTVGSSDSPDLQVEESLKALILLAGSLVIDAQDNLQQGGHIGTGKLADSFKVLDPSFTGKKINVDVQAIFYYQYLNRGVKGTKSGSGEFAFKTQYPSRKMVNEIQKWIKRAGLSSFNVKKSVSTLEHRRKSISQLNQGRSVAYAVATSIKQHGIKKTGFFDKAINTTAARVDEEIGKAFKVDVINSLPDKL